MVKKVKMLLVSVLMLSAVSIPALSVAGVASAQGVDIQGNLCGGANFQLNNSSQTCANEDNTQKVNDLIAQIVNILSVIVAMVAVVMIIVGGFKYISSGGDSTKVTGAKNTILYAIIGLIIVALAQFIVRFVLSKSGDLT